MTSNHQDTEITRFVGYVLIRRLALSGHELHVERIYDTETRGPVFGESISSELSLGNDDEVVGIIPAADTEKTDE